MKFFFFFESWKFFISVATALYPFFFLFFAPRIASNREESKIWGSCCPKTDYVLLPKKFLFPAKTSNWSETFWAYASDYCITFVSLALFDLSNRRFLKKSIFTDCSVLTDFCLFIHFASETFSFWVLLEKELFEEWYSRICYFWCFYLHVKAEPSWSIILIILMLLIRIVLSFVWSEFSSVGREEWCNKMKNGQKLKLGDAHVTPRNIQEVQASKLGDAHASPLHQQKYQVIFQYAIFLLLHMICVILGAS